MPEVANPSEIEGFPDLIDFVDEEINIPSTLSDHLVDGVGQSLRQQCGSMTLYYIMNLDEEVMQQL